MLVRRLHTYTDRYAHLIPALALLSGFIFDVFTLKRPDEWFENLSMLGYLLASAILITILQRSSAAFRERTYLFLFSALQFSFGHLAGVLMVLYARSGTFAGSAIFIVLLGTLFLGHEVLKNHYARNTLRISLWYFFLLTYLVLIVPIVVHQMGVLIFALSVALSLGVIYLLLVLLARFAHMDFKAHTRGMHTSILSIAFVFTLLYLGNFIPPVPLATRQMDIYHSVLKRDNSYLVSYEQPQWYRFWKKTSSQVHITQGAPLYCFSAVFAPGNLTTEIYHQWSKFNPNRKTWESKARIPFPIKGGRASGYRGYTYLTHLTSGQWRCRAETKQGAALGQVFFRVIESSTTPTLRIMQI